MNVAETASSSLEVIHTKRDNDCRSNSSSSASSSRSPAGFIGSLLGLGGGLIVIPTLTLALKVDIRYAIGASIVSIIATSSGAAAAYVRERMTNLRVAMVLEIATTLGALTGGYMAGRIAGRWLFVVFGVVMACSAVMMLRKRRNVASDEGEGTPWANYLRLRGSYYDGALNKEVPYRVVRARLGLGLMYIAGMMSGLLGIGSGVLKVPAMDLAHAPADQGLHRDEQLHDRRHRRRQRGAVFRARRHQPVHRRARRGRDPRRRDDRRARHGPAAPRPHPVLLRGRAAPRLGPDAPQGTERTLS